MRTTFRGALGLFRQSLRGHLEKLLVSDKSHAKHGKTHLFAKGLFSGLVGLGEKFEFFEVPINRDPETALFSFRTHYRPDDYFSQQPIIFVKTSCLSLCLSL